MKKTDNKSFDDFPPVTLYLNDIHEIMDVLKSNCETVKLETMGFTDVQPEELNELVSKLGVERFENISINTYKPYISVQLYSSGIKIYLSENGINERGVISKLRDIFELRKKRHFNKLLNILNILPAGACGVALVEKEYAFAGAMVAINLLLITLIVKYQMAHTVVVLTNRNNEYRTSFLKRNKDELLVALVSAFAGALISFVLIKYFAN